MAAQRSKDFDRYLLDGERLVTAVHAHWAKVAEPVASFVAATIAAFYIDINVPADAGLLAQVAWTGWWFVFGRMLWLLVQWRRDWFVATDKRLLLFHGFITRKAAMMPLSEVTDMSYHRSVPGRIVGYGTFVMESAGQEQALSEIGFMPDPDHHYRAICAEIFGVEDADRVLDDGEGPTGGGYADGPRPDGGRGPTHPSGGSAQPGRVGPITTEQPSRWGRWRSRQEKVETGRDDATMLYRSPELDEADRRNRRAADTGEIPLYPPGEWR